MKLRTKYWKGFGFFWGVGVVVLVLLVVFLLGFFPVGFPCLSSEKHTIPDDCLWSDLGSLGRGPILCLVTWSNAIKGSKSDY